MDGYHLTRAQLDAMPDPAAAHARRGAAFTFDGEGFLRLVRRLREPLTDRTTTIFAPSFDHALKDPREDDIPIERTHRIVVLEGNCGFFFSLSCYSYFHSRGERIFVLYHDASSSASAHARNQEPPSVTPERTSGPSCQRSAHHNENRIGHFSLTTLPPPPWHY